MIFAPYDDMERFTISVNEVKPFAERFGTPNIAWQTDVIEPTQASLRLWAYLNDHLDATLLNAGAIAADLGWSRTEVFDHMHNFLRMNYIQCDRADALGDPMNRLLL